MVLNQEIDDVIKGMNSPNPSTGFYKRTGPAVHYTQENEDKMIRESHEDSKRLEFSHRFFALLRDAQDFN